MTPQVRDAIVTINAVSAGLNARNPDLLDRIAEDAGLDGSRPDRTMEQRVWESLCARFDYRPLAVYRGLTSAFWPVWQAGRGDSLRAAARLLVDFLEVSPADYALPRFSLEELAEVVQACDPSDETPTPETLDALERSAFASVDGEEWQAFRLCRRLAGDHPQRVYRFMVEAFRARWEQGEYGATAEIAQFLNRWDARAPERVQ